MTTQNNDYTIQRSLASVAETNARFMASVYRWMTGGLLTTAAVSYFVASSPGFVEALVTNRMLFWALVIAQFGSVIWLSAGIRKMSVGTAAGVFFAYSALVGVTLSLIFMVYTGSSIMSTFLISAGSFAGLSAFGYATKKDLGPIGSFCVMGLWGLVLFSIVSMIFPSLYTSSAQIVTSVVGIIVFSGLTAYDTQKIKAFGSYTREGTDESTKGAISGALILYLDFLNLFLSILRFTGRKR